MLGDEPVGADAATTPTKVRYLVVSVTALTSLLLYLDRVCISFAERFFKADLALSDADSSWILSAFFWSYAICQVPAGWFSDRYGPRRMLTIYVLAWSLFTALTGLAWGFWSLFLMRLGLGIAQAGAYPTSANLLSKWVPISSRGRASSVVAFGGRVGGAIAPFLTAKIIVLVALPGFGWRVAMVGYGAIGLVVAGVYWFYFRDRPVEHPQCNAAEVALVETGRGLPSSTRPSTDIPWRAILSSRSLWLDSVSQVGTNIGWAFLITWLPRYLDEVHAVSVEQRGALASIPLFAGWLGMLCGGWATDSLVRWAGLRWGRVLPIAFSRFLAAAAYLVCLLPVSPELATLAFCVVAIGTDLGIGAAWAFKQDIGGSSVGAVLGWGNMWGNFGAALSPLLLNWAIGSTLDWNTAFVTCAIAFGVAGVAALGIDATVPLHREENSRVRPD